MEKARKQAEDQMEREKNSMLKRTSSKDSADRDASREGAGGKLGLTRSLSEIGDTYATQASFVSWPMKYVIHSRPHTLRFGQDINRLSDVRLAPRLPREYAGIFPDWILRLILCGVGVYDETRMTDYQRRMMMKALPGLASLWSGRSIVFGTNIEGLTHLFIHSSFGVTANRNFLFQLMGRTGRSGLSYESTIVVDHPEVVEKIMDVSSFYNDPLFALFNIAE